MDRIITIANLTSCNPHIITVKSSKSTSFIRISKLTKQKRELLRSLVNKTIILRYTTAESLSYIKQELGVSISESYFFEVKANITEENQYIMEHYGEKMHASLLTEFVKKIREMELIQLEQWAIYHKTDDLKFMQTC